ncbi:hypothetical protein L2E82_14180 [Cichorium intybus]|uniref:Uncharacterized protein n=1 Tax=Cichorium intybus TaxID=13427 RepID=A0ACB9EZ94_CICIN|nr:hypothetical protein L2E82_14180 [Cichorium intybus]
MDGLASLARMVLKSLYAPFSREIVLTYQVKNDNSGNQPGDLNGQRSLVSGVLIGIVVGVVETAVSVVSSASSRLNAFAEEDDGEGKITTYGKRYSVSKSAIVFADEG